MQCVAVHLSGEGKTVQGTKERRERRERKVNWLSVWRQSHSLSPLLITTFRLNDVVAAVARSALYHIRRKPNSNAKREAGELVDWAKQNEQRHSFMINLKKVERERERERVKDENKKERPSRYTSRGQLSCWSKMIKEIETEETGER